MKNLLLLTICFLLTITKISAQIPAVMPVNANEFYDNSMPLLRPEVRSVILKEASGMKHRKANVDSLSRALKSMAVMHGLSSTDIDGIIVLIMVQASKNADTDLKDMVMGISHEKEEKKRDNKKASEDSAVESKNTKLQMIMNHKSDIAEEVSYVMRKISADEQSIINNLK